MTPASSMIFPWYWVIRKLDSLEVETGIISVRSLGAMMMPAA